MLFSIHRLVVTMSQSKHSCVFHDATGKTVVSIRYAENVDSQTLEIAFSDATIFAFDFSASVSVRAQALISRDGKLDLVHNYDRFRICLFRPCRFSSRHKQAA
jgi:hypothetical protein